MFTPQRKSWAFSPRAGDSANPRSAILGKSKGKAVAGTLDQTPAPPPPKASLGENGGERGGGGEVEVWRRFRDEGLLDESVLERKDREALASRILELENELHEYQYNMGLLLIEKKEWSSRYDEIRSRLSEAEEILKREQTAHIIALTESEKREENLRKALGVEKQCVTDLEKAIREMRAEVAEIKFTSEKKLAEARALEASIEEKYLEVERKLHSADAKLAEASRKSSEVDRKLEDVEALERKLQRESLSINADLKAKEKDISEQRDHLRNWEKKLQDGQKRLVDGQRFLNEREEKANETDRVLKKKEEVLEEARRLIDVTTNSVKDKEEDVDSRLRALTVKEKEVDVKMKNLEKKEKDLMAIEEKLNAREREEIQKIVDDHKATLDAKKHEFELKLEKKRRDFDLEIKSKVDALDKEKKEINHREEQFSKREQTLQSKLEKLEMKEKNLDAKSKVLKNWETSLKSNEKKLEEENQQLKKDSEELVASRTALEQLIAAMETEKHQIICEKENLTLTKEERAEHLKLQSQLKQEIEDYRMMKESLVKEIEALREEREKFEREWEALDEKRVALETEVMKVDDERQKLEKWRHNEQERLKNEELQARADIERELEDLRLKKEAFDNTMEHERSVAREDIKRELADVTREFELRKHDLEISMLEKQEDMEKKLQEKEKEFNTRRELDLNRIASTANLNESKARKLKAEQDQLDRDKEEFSVQKKKLEADQLEIQKDIDTLRVLSKNLKDQRAVFMKEREQFLAAAKRCKTCHNCGVSISELEVINLEPVVNEDVVLPSLADGYLQEHGKGKLTIPSPSSGGQFSFLKKCTGIFKFSPRKIVEHSTQNQAENPIQFVDRLNMVVSEEGADDGLTNNEERQEKPVDEPEASLEVGDNSIEIVKISEYSFREDEGEHAIVSTLEPNEMEGSSKQQRRRQPSRRGRPKTVKRTRSVKAVVEDAKAILGDKDLKVDGEANGDAGDSQHIDEESQGVSVHADPEIIANARQKRRRPQTSEMTNSEMEAEDSEAQSQSLSIGGRRSRRKISTTEVPAPGDRRYNLRRSTVASSVAASQATSDQAKGHKRGSRQHSPDNEALKGDHVVEGPSKDVAIASPSSDFVEDSDKITHMQHKSAVGLVTEIHEISSQKLVQREMKEVRIESDVIKSVELSDGTQEDGEEVDGAETTATSDPSTPSGGGSYEMDEDEEEDEEKHNASIGKKLWTFFTT